MEDGIVNVPYLLMTAIGALAAVVTMLWRQVEKNHAVCLEREKVCREELDTLYKSLAEKGLLDRRSQ